MKSPRTARSLISLCVAFVPLLTVAQTSLPADPFIPDSIPAVGDLPTTSAEGGQAPSWTNAMLLDAARRAWNERRLRDAAAYLDRITSGTESSILLADAWLERGKINTALKNYGAARLNFNQAIQETEYHVDEETADSTLVGESLYWIAVTHLLEPPLPMYDQAVRCLDSSAYIYPSNPRAGDALLILGMLKEGRHDYDGALRAYRTLQERYPDRPISGQAAIRAAQSLLLLDRQKDAIAQLDTSIYRFPVEPERGICIDCELLRANAYLSLDDYPAAERSFLAVLDVGEAAHRRQAMLGLGDTYLAAGRVDSATALYRRLSADSVTDRAAMIAELHYAIALAEAGEDSLSTKLLRSAASRPEAEAASYALFELGRRSYAHQQYERSIKLLDSALLQAPGLSLRGRAHHLRGAAYFSLGNTDSAAAAFHRADSVFALVPARPGTNDVALESRTRLLAGIALAESGRTTEAITTLNRYLQQAPAGRGSAEALYWLAEAYYQSKLYQSTAQSLEDMIERFPNSPRTEAGLYMLGWAYFKQSKFGKAEASFAQLVKAYPLSPRRMEAQLRRADCFYLRKEYAEAAQLYSQIARDTTLITGSEYAHYQAGLASYRAEDDDGAVELLTTFEQRHPASVLAPDAEFARAMADLRRDSVTRGIEELHRFALRHHGNHLLPRAYMVLGDAYARIDDEAAAEAAYRIVGHQLPTSQYAERGRAAITELTGIRDQRRDADTTGIELRYPTPLAMLRADMLLLAGNARGSLDSYRRLALHDSSRVSAPAYMLGMLRGMVAIGDTAGLIDTLNIVTSLYPGSVAAEALFTVGRASETIDTARAGALYRRLRAEYPTSGPAGSAALREAEMLVIRGEGEAARGLLRQTAELNDTAESGARAWLLLAELEEAAGNADSARSALMRAAVRGDSLGAEATMRLVGYDIRRGDTAAATARLESAIERYPTHPEVRCRAQIMLAGLYENSGQAELARTIYQTIIRERPNDRLGAEARDRLQSLIRH